MLLQANRGAEAEAEINAAIKAYPNNPQLSDALLYVYFSEQKLDDALNLANAAIAANPNDLPARYYRGLIELYSSKPDVNAAIDDLKFVIDQSPNHLDARIALASAYAMTNDLPDAIHELEAALHLAPDNKNVRLQLVQFYKSSTPPKWIDAEQVLDDALAMPQYKNDVDLLRSAALMWSGQGDNTKAIGSIRAAMAQAPEDKSVAHPRLSQHPSRRQELLDAVAGDRQTGCRSRHLHLVGV